MVSVAKEHQRGLVAECSSCDHEVNFADAGQLIDTTLAFFKEDCLLSRTVRNIVQTTMLAVLEDREIRPRRQRNMLSSTTASKDNLHSVYRSSLSRVLLADRTSCISSLTVYL